MDLDTYYLSLTAAEKTQFRIDAGEPGRPLSPSFIWQLRFGKRKPNLALCTRMTKASGGALTLLKLNPDIAEQIEQQSQLSA